MPDNCGISTSLKPSLPILFIINSFINHRRMKLVPFALRMMTKRRQKMVCMVTVTWDQTEDRRNPIKIYLSRLPKDPCRAVSTLGKVCVFLPYSNWWNYCNIRNFNIWKHVARKKLVLQRRRWTSTPCQRRVYLCLPLPMWEKFSN